ncbi:MAG: ubiquitin-like domain-containing protein [Candidatus Methylomirabilales bacterium]
MTLTDGLRVTRAKTFAPTVGDALLRLGVQMGPRDRVVPSLSAPVGKRIEVRRAKQVTLVLNGQPKSASVTAPTVGEALKELAVDLHGAFIHPAPAAPLQAGTQVVVAQPANVTLVHDQKNEVVTSNSLTARELLHRFGIELGPLDRVEPDPGAYPSAGSTIKVVRVREVLERTPLRIPFKKVTEQTAKLELGLRKVTSKGIEGLAHRVHLVLYEDGALRHKDLVATEVTRAPRDEVTLVGTRRPVFASNEHSETGKATWYRFPGLGAAHKTLPKGTVVKVTNLANGRQVVVVIRDRGPWGPGRIIDLSDTAFRELAPLRTGVLNVKIEW